MKLKAILILCGLISICGCAGSKNFIPRDYKGDDAGYVILSLGASTETKYQSYALLIRKIDKSAETLIMYLPDNMFGSTKKDFVDDDSHGFVSVRRFPQGEYEIYNFDIFSNLGLIQTHYKAKNDFSIPFSVETGKTIYLGEYIAFTVAKGLFGTSTGGAVFIITDEQQRDLDFIKKNDLNISIENVSNSTPDPEKVGCPLLRSKL